MTHVDRAVNGTKFHDAHQNASISTLCLNDRLASCLSFHNCKSAFNKEEALVGAFSGHCEIMRSPFDSSGIEVT